MGAPPDGGLRRAAVLGGAVWWKERCHAHAEDARERVTERGTLDGPAAVETGRHEHTIAITSERRF